ncbi:predicted protein [Lichtheimia corymbifera JMRC:FSU:9682]|uniref:Uncharacterized protein n=1 Tax=Lichtheimia corymbifera JMRC:FSU:9682 TaxID=1263082 RepID=A0A068S431_9FUNG|nr:predicted protein [Lichtheimia corymbifera JMRC:FSU:9682]
MSNEFRTSIVSNTRFSGGSRYWPIAFKRIQQRMSLMGLSIEQLIRRQVPFRSFGDSLQQHDMVGMEIRFLFEGKMLLRITTSIKKAFPWLYHWHVKDVIVLPIQTHPLTTVAACGSTAQVVPKSTDEGLIWVTVKSGVLAPCFLRVGASRQYWYLGILWHCALFVLLCIVSGGGNSSGSLPPDGEIRMGYLALKSSGLQSSLLSIVLCVWKIAY